uniref:SERRATE/Ars2 C-terminal domain-containing protein n=1 Tax=Coturnix japonica TaxID=93934 RepID=A0A8C2SQ44_COTJA
MGHWGSGLGRWAVGWGSPRGVLEDESRHFGPEFVRKHIFNKHSEKIAEVRKEVLFFNNFLQDPKRPALPEGKGGPPPGPAQGLAPGLLYPPQTPQGMMPYGQPRPPILAPQLGCGKAHLWGLGGSMGPEGVWGGFYGAGGGSMGLLWGWSGSMGLEGIWGVSMGLGPPLWKATPPS